MALDDYVTFFGNTMQTINDTQTRWTVSVPKETDLSLRCFLAERGMKKGGMSKFIVDAVKWRVFEQTAAEIREKFADVFHHTNTLLIYSVFNIK